MEPSGIEGFALGAQDAGYTVSNNHAAFLREQQQLALEYAVREPRVQRAFLVTWTERGWPAEELEALLARFNSDPTTTESWRMQSHRQCAVGDKIYALKQGDGPKTIFGVGEIVSAPFEKTWDSKVHWMVDVKFDRLVHPLRDALVTEDQVKAILPSQLIRHQASGISLGRSAAWKLDVLINAGKDASSDWNQRELDAVIPAYFDMLTAEIDGKIYSKAESRSKLLEVIRRSAGAIEFKHQNISAVLDRLGKTWIGGYKPRHNTQEALTRAVEAHLAAAPDIDLQITPAFPL